jgi:hypothetical protein
MRDAGSANFLGIWNVRVSGEANTRENNGKDFENHGGSLACEGDFRRRST